VLPQEHLFCWEQFDRACTVFCSKSITGRLCDFGRECMVSFCMMFQDLYGKAACVTNMHFSYHLDEYLCDHGPAYGFWLFLFERMNDLLGDTYTNKHDTAPQFTRHFMNKCTTLDLVHDLLDDLHTTFFPSGLISDTKRASGGVQILLTSWRSEEHDFLYNLAVLKSTSSTWLQARRFHRSSSILSLCI